MIDLQKAQKAFLEYTNNYDLNNANITRKISHSIRVMDYSKRIAENINLTKEQVDLATLIGLLHDIARFEQWTRYETYNDSTSIDHGDFAVEILKENDFIRNFIDTDIYDDIIYTAIKNHNKYKIEELEGEKLIQAQIIKDADKLDIYYQIATQYFKDPRKTETEDISDEFFEEFKQEQCVHKRPNPTEIDELILIVSFIYDIYFNYSFRILNDEKFIERIFAQFDFKKPDVKEKIDKIIKQANTYIKNKM